jgi:hypothetical protein
MLLSRLRRRRRGIIRGEGVDLGCVMAIPIPDTRKSNISLHAYTEIVRAAMDVLSRDYLNKEHFYRTHQRLTHQGLDRPEDSQTSTTNTSLHDINLTNELYQH